jgi:hypothetical protein
VAQNPSSPPTGLIAIYRGVALFLLNTLLLFGLLNVGAALVLSWLPDPDLRGAMTYGLEKLRRVYPDRTDKEIRQLLYESWSRAYRYEPFTQFKEGAFSGQYVNVSEEGFRDTGRELPWPPAQDRLNVFVFGGSTTFGYGLGDRETIPARLHEALEPVCGERVAVYNLARSNYFSSQENVLFQRLLAHGVRPAMAVFVDGLNDFAYTADEPKFTRRLAFLMDETPPQTSRRALVNLPLARLLKRWVVRGGEPAAKEAEPAVIDSMLDRWIRNRRQIRAVAQDAGVMTLFVWQPIPGYGYDLDSHLFAADADRNLPPGSPAYDRMDRLRQVPDGPLTEDFLWLADLQRGRDEPLYVDRVHYAAGFADEIAREIGRSVGARLCSDREAPR